MCEICDDPDTTEKSRNALFLLPKKEVKEMTITLFISILTIGSAVSSILTECIKTLYKESKKDYSANLIALINAIVIGCGGTALVYRYMNIPFNTDNIIALVLMSACVWVSETVGYDKVTQLINQIKG